MLKSEPIVLTARTALVCFVFVGWFQMKWSNMKNVQNGENKTKGEYFETGENVDINSLNQTRGNLFIWSC